MGKYKHGMCNTKIYRSYACAKARCTCPTDRAYPQYGGRGIKFLRDSFEDFYKDMGEPFEEHLKQWGVLNTSLDRIDNNGNYCKENCRRATRKQQAVNRNYAIKISYHGVDYPSLSVFCEKLGLDYKLTRDRLKHGWTLEDAVDEGLWRRDGIEYNGKRYKSLRGLCKELGLKYGTVRKRINKLGYSLEGAINSKKILYDGQKYQSIAALCREKGINEKTLYTRISRGMSLEEAIEAPINEKMQRMSQKALNKKQQTMPKKILMICGETCVKCKFLKPHLEARAQKNGVPFEKKDINEAIPSEIEGASSLPVIWFDDKQIEYDEALTMISNNNG